MKNKESYRVTPSNIEALCANEIFVFGSNVAGIHSSGAAYTALGWGAVMGKESGLQGNTYAIPTTFKSVSEIEPYVNEFINFARNHPNLIFYVTEIGCGHAGHETENIASLFKSAVNIDNISLPNSFWHILNNCFSNRLKAIIEQYSITPIDFVEYIGVKPSHGMNLIIGIDYPNISDIQKILIKYPDINARWLLLGDGDILID